MPKTCGLDLEAIEKRCEAAENGDSREKVCSNCYPVAYDIPLLIAEIKRLSQSEAALREADKARNYFANERDRYRLMFEQSEAALRVAREALEKQTKGWLFISKSCADCEILKVAHNALTKINSIPIGE
jgi:hypothetical protein